LSTRERSRIQTFPAHWDLCGNKSDIEQIIGNAVPCALGEFVGLALAQFDEMPHHKAKPSVESVSVFVQYENVRNGDIHDVALEPIEQSGIADAEDVNVEHSDYTFCKPIPAQLLLAVERKKAKLGKRAVKRGLAGTKLVQRKAGKKAAAGGKRSAK